MQEARAISNTYSNALRSAESLIERDTLNLQEQLHTTESELKRADAKIQASNRLLLERSEALDRLHHTHKESIRILASFIQHNVQHWVKDFYESDAQDVMQVISDQNHNCDDSHDPYIRIPESVYLDNMATLSEAGEQIEQYREVVKGQNKMIKDQSAQLDKQLEKYEGTLNTIKERDHELVLMCQRNSDLETKVETYELALRRSQEVTKERDQAKKDVKELQRELKQLTGLMKLQLEEKDSTIADLRQQLGSAREEIIARRADVKNVITQTQAMLVPRENGIDYSRRGVSKSPRPFGKIKDKTKSPEERMPHSKSSLFLGFQHLNYDMMTSPHSHPDSKYSSKEVVDCDKGKFHLSCNNSSSSSERTKSSTPTRGRRSSDPFCDVKHRPDSRGTARDSSSMRSQGSGGGSIGDTQKSLPVAPPPTMLPKVPTSSSLLHPNDAASPHFPSSHDISNAGFRTPARRILSLIPEASVEDSDSVRAPSATSSEKEVYRRSLHALNVLSSDSVQPEDDAASASESDTVKMEESSMVRDSSENSLSEILTVSQMYHGGEQSVSGGRSGGGGARRAQGHIRS